MITRRDREAKTEAKKRTSILVRSFSRTLQTGAEVPQKKTVTAAMRYAFFTGTPRNFHLLKREVYYTPLLPQIKDKKCKNSTRNTCKGKRESL
jgi:hypothetical protein